jgi:hypothetical protein
MITLRLNRGLKALAYVSLASGSLMAQNSAAFSQPPPPQIPET